jgi:hypothetical protein
MRRTLFGIALIFLHFAAAGQAIIPFAGGNLSWYQVKGDNYSSNPVMGVNAGALADINLSSMFLSLQSGLQYTRTGGEIVLANPGLAAPNRILYRVDAIQLPVMLTLKIGDEDGYYFAGAGFYVTANIGGTRDVKIPVVVDPFGHNHPLHYRESLQFGGKFDFGLNTGAGYHFANGLELYAFYQNGSVDIHPFIPLSRGYYSDPRTYQAGLTVRYALKPGRKKAKKKSRPETGRSLRSKTNYHTYRFSFSSMIAPTPVPAPAPSRPPIMAPLPFFLSTIAPVIAPTPVPITAPLAFPLQPFFVLVSLALYSVVLAGCWPLQLRELS